MFDLKKIESEARAEIAEETGKVAKAKIKGMLQKIAASRTVTANLEREYDMLLMEIGA